MNVSRAAGPVRRSGLALRNTMADFTAKPPFKSSVCLVLGGGAIGDGGGCVMWYDPAQRSFAPLKMTYVAS